MALLRRIATIALGLVLLFEAAVTAFNIWNISIDWDPIILLWLTLPIPLVLFVSGVWVLTGRFWPVLLPIVYVAAITLYSLAISAPLPLPWL